MQIRVHLHILEHQSQTLGPKKIKRKRKKHTNTRARTHTQNEMALQEIKKQIYTVAHWIMFGMKFTSVVVFCGERGRAAAAESGSRGLRRRNPGFKR